MLRLAIALFLVVAACALMALLVRSVWQTVETETGRMKDSGGPMPRIAFFLLLCVMAYAIATGAA